MASKERFLFAKFALDFADSRKVLPLSDSAFRCLVEAIIWSRKEESDGWLARRLALAKWSLDDLLELSTNDPENPSLIEHEDGWQIHDFTLIQDTKAEIDARREHAKLAGRRGGLARAKRTAKQPAKRTASKPSSKTQAETETDSLLTDVSRERPRKRAHRLPNDWRPDQTVIDQMRSEHPEVDLKFEHAKFCDYWQAKSGKDATKVDWNATWRNWIRRAAEHTPTLRAVPNNRPAASDAAYAQAQSLKNNPGRLEINP